MKTAAYLAAAMLGVATPAFAQYAPPPYAMAPPYAVAPRYAPVPPEAMLPPFEAMTVARSVGLEPISRPVLRGRVYVVHSIDDQGFPVRAIVDARSGTLLRVVASRPYARGPYGGWRAARGGPGMPDDPELAPPEPIPGPAVRAPAEPGVRQAPPKVATRTPLPRPAPRQTQPARKGGGLAATPDAKPGKSIPAPVAGRAKDATASVTPPPQGEAGASAPDRTPTGSTPAAPAKASEPSSGVKDLHLVPVAPLE
jgi:hypothetical protein